MGRMLLIANPIAGKSKIKGNLLSIVDIFIKAGWEVEVHTTQSKLDAMHTAQKRGGDVDLLVCSGGDGTLSETISGIMELQDPPVLGYIPAGSTNDFASSLKIPKRMTDAAANVVNGEPRDIDIGRFCGDKHFIYVAGFGMFTEVSYMTPQQEKNLIGHQAYVLEGMRSLGNIKSYHMRVESEEFSMEEDFIFGMVTNTTSVGGFKGLVSNNVALDDGVFEVLLVRTPTTAIELTNILSSMVTKEEHNEYVHRFRTAKLKLRCDEPVDWVLDGEFGGTHREVEIENLTKRIKIVAGIVKKR